MRRTVYIGLFLLLLLLSACSGRNQYEPFTPLSRVTVSPEREAAVQAALNGDLSLPEAAAPTEVPADDPFEVPSFDEDMFFAEVAQSTEPVVIPTEAAPFEEVPTATPMPPTATPIPPKPTAVNPYGTGENGLTTYTLQAGEDLVCLARRFNISLSQLVSQNNLSSANDAGPGDVITFPRNPSPWSTLDGYGNRMANRHPVREYTVQSGESLFSIACYFGDIRPEDIASRNGLTYGEPLTPGITIYIP